MPIRAETAKVLANELENPRLDDLASIRWSDVDDRKIKGVTACLDGLFIEVYERKDSNECPDVSIEIDVSSIEEGKFIAEKVLSRLDVWREDFKKLETS